MKYLSLVLLVALSGCGHAVDATAPSTATPAPAIQPEFVQPVIAAVSTPTPTPTPTGTIIATATATATPTPTATPTLAIAEHVSCVNNPGGTSAYTLNSTVYADGSQEVTCAANGVACAGPTDLPSVQEGFITAVSTGTIYQFYGNQNTINYWVDQDWDVNVTLNDGQFVVGLYCTTSP